MPILCTGLLLSCAPKPLSPRAAAPAPSCVAPAVTRSPSYNHRVVAHGAPPFEMKFGERIILAGIGKYHLPDQDSNWNQMYGWGPVVWIKDGKKTGVLDLRAQFPSNMVSHVFADDRTGRVFVFLDYGVEGPSHTYVVWISLDRGETWFQGADLPRPAELFPPSNLESFSLARDGRGIAWLKKEGDAEDSIYRVTTEDCGLSWNAEATPIFTSVLHAVEQKP